MAPEARGESCCRSVRIRSDRQGSARSGAWSSLSGERQDLALAELNTVQQLRLQSRSLTAPVRGCPWILGQLSAPIPATRLAASRRRFGKGSKSQAAAGAACPGDAAPAASPPRRGSSFASPAVSNRHPLRRTRHTSAHGPFLPHGRMRASQSPATRLTQRERALARSEPEPTEDRIGEVETSFARCAM